MTFNSKTRVFYDRAMNLDEKLTIQLKTSKIDNINVNQVDKLAEMINTSCMQIQKQTENNKKLLTIYRNIRKTLIRIFYLFFINYVTKH